MIDLAQLEALATAALAEQTARMQPPTGREELRDHFAKLYADWFRGPDDFDTPEKALELLGALPLDAVLELVRLARAGQVFDVWPPEPTDEALEVLMPINGLSRVARRAIYETALRFARSELLQSG